MTRVLRSLGNSLGHIPAFWRDGFLHHWLIWTYMNYANVPSQSPKNILLGGNSHSNLKRNKTKLVHFGVKKNDHFYTFFFRILKLKKKGMIRRTNRTINFTVYIKCSFWKKMGTAVAWVEWFILRSHYFYCQNKNTDSLFVYFEETFQLLSINSLK